MLAAVFIPGDIPLVQALASPIAQEAIDRNFGLYTNGDHACLFHPESRPGIGWARVGVRVKDLLAEDGEAIAPEAA